MPLSTLTRRSGRTGRREFLSLAISISRASAIQTDRPTEQETLAGGYHRFPDLAFRAAVRLAIGTCDGRTDGHGILSSSVAKSVGLKPWCPSPSKRTMFKSDAAWDRSIFFFSEYFFPSIILHQVRRSLKSTCPTPQSWPGPVRYAEQQHNMSSSNKEHIEDAMLLKHAINTYHA